MKASPLNEGRVAEAKPAAPIRKSFDAGCKLVVCITEGVPVMDLIKVRFASL